MVKVEFILKNLKSIIIEDKNEEYSDELRDKLSNILKSTKLTIIETETEKFFIKPTTIDSIILTKIEEKIPDSPIKLEQNKKETVDIITDVD